MREAMERWAEYVTLCRSELDNIVHMTRRDSSTGVAKKVVKAHA
jgi:hypothetical protein